MSISQLHTYTPTTPLGMLDEEIAQIIAAINAIVPFDPAADLDNNARVAVRKNTGADVGERRRLNFIEGSNVTLTITDDSGSEEVDITIAASGGGGGGDGSLFNYLTLRGGL